MKTEYKIDVILTIAEPFITSSGTDARRGLDMLFARNAEGRPIITHSHIKGKLREALQTLSDIKQVDADQVKALLGVACGETIHKGNGENDLSTLEHGDYQPKRGHLSISDFTLTGVVNDAKKTGMLARTSIDPETRTASDGQLFTTETLLRAGDQTNWQGRFCFFADDDDAAGKLRETLELALKWIPAFGAIKGAGYGRFKEVSIAPPQPVAKPALELNKAKNTIGLNFIFENDLFIGGVKQSANFEASEKIIPGGVIKGAFARFLNQVCGAAELTDQIDAGSPVANHFSDLAEHFDKLRFLHALPATEPSRPVPIPQSAVQAGDEFYDVADMPTSSLINEKTPTFQIDWKGKALSEKQKEFGWANLQMVSKTRTAIHPETHAAMDEKLYTFQYISPEDDSGHKINWLSGVSFAPDVPEGAFQQLKKALQLGWNKLGKRDARFKLQAITSAWPDTQEGETAFAALKTGDTVYVTLRTDALLFDARAHAGAQPDLLEIYRNYWRDQLGDAAELSHFFARQKLVGGFLARKQMKHNGQKGYYPWALTTAGSVFVLKVKGPAALSKHLQEFRQTGLPLYDNTLNWQSCPFVPQNGYGEIIVNLNWQKIKNFSPKGIQK